MAFNVVVLFWLLCAFFMMLMVFTMEHDERLVQEAVKESLLQRRQELRISSEVINILGPPSNREKSPQAALQRSMSNEYSPLPRKFSISRANSYINTPGPSEEHLLPESSVQVQVPSSIETASYLYNDRDNINRTPYDLPLGITDVVEDSSVSRLDTQNYSSDSTKLSIS